MFGLKREQMNLGTLVRVTRIPFTTAVILPALLGGAIAWTEGVFHAGYLLLTIVGIVAINVGLNMSNDYFDHTSGLDEINRHLTPFSGGSRVIQDGLLTPKWVLVWSAAFYLIGIAIGLYLTAVRGPLLLWIGVLGVFFAVFHNAPPIRLYHRVPGLGELATGIGCGPLVVLGSYYVQTQEWGVEALWASIPMALLITAVLYINEFPDYEADKAVGKKTLPGMLGRQRAVWGYVALLASTYVVVVLGTVLGILPYPTLLAVLSLPLASRAIRGAMLYYDDPQRLIPTNAMTVQLHLVTGVLLCLGYVVAGFLA